jgi:hypothetical protein
MKINFVRLLLFVFLSLLVVSCEKADILRADDTELEILLDEIDNDGDSLCSDTPIDESNNPPRPNQFRATIKGRMLSVSADTPNPTLIIVRNSAGSLVFSQQFIGFKASRLSTSGAYTIVIRCSNLTLGGHFSAH